MSTRRRDPERARQREHKRQKERQEQQVQQQRTNQALSNAFNQQNELSRNWMAELLDVDDLEDRLQPNTIRKIQSMLNQEWVLANLTDAEAHDKIYWLEVQRYKLTGHHPPEQSAITGPVRAFLMDDEYENLEPLTAQERNAIDQIIKTLQNRVTRSRGGFERKQLNTSISRAETETDTDEQEDNIFQGFFS